MYTLNWPNAVEAGGWTAGPAAEAERAMGVGYMSRVYRQPTVRYRIMATCWEAEEYVEAFAESQQQAEAIANAFRAMKAWGDMDVQIDELIDNDRVRPQAWPR